MVKIKIFYVNVATSDLMMLEFLWYEIFIASLGKASKKRIFYGQADRRGKCQNFDPFFIEIRFFDTQNTFFHCEGSQ